MYTKVVYFGSTYSSKTNFSGQVEERLLSSSYHQLQVPISVCHWSSADQRLCALPFIPHGWNCNRDVDWAMWRLWHTPARGHLCVWLYVWTSVWQTCSLSIFQRASEVLGTCGKWKMSVFCHRGYKRHRNAHWIRSIETYTQRYWRRSLLGKLHSFSEDLP